MKIARNETSPEWNKEESHRPAWCYIQITLPMDDSRKYTFAQFISTYIFAKCCNQ